MLSEYHQLSRCVQFFFVHHLLLLLVVFFLLPVSVRALSTPAEDVTHVTRVMMVVVAVALTLEPAEGFSVTAVVVTRRIGIVLSVVIISLLFMLLIPPILIFFLLLIMMILTTTTTSVAALRVIIIVILIRLIVIRFLRVVVNNGWVIGVIAPSRLLNRSLQDTLWVDPQEVLLLAEGFQLRVNDLVDLAFERLVVIGLLLLLSNCTFLVVDAYD